MSFTAIDDISYSIMDPTGNITALVESSVDISEQTSVADMIMQRHSDVEQVGFVDFSDENRPSLRMAGGEFCGNASMSAAALYTLRSSLNEEAAVSVFLRVSGVAEPIRVDLRKDIEGLFLGSVHMPPAIETVCIPFTFGNLSGNLPVVRMEGISHILIEPDSPFFELKKDRPAAEKAVKQFCDQLSADCLGLMFLEGDEPQYTLSPLVYVPSGETCFWENSCASGSSAAGMYLASKKARPVSLSLKEPGGLLKVSSVPKGETILYGTVRKLSSYCSL